jgi:acyl-CoA thioesterase-1
MTIQKSIALLGDSITTGYLVELNQCYTRLLQTGINKYDISFYQFSIGGLTTTQALPTITRAFELGHTYDACILALGINDVIQNVPPETIINNIQALAQMFMAHNVPVILGNIDLTAWADLTPAGYPAEFNSALATLINSVGFMYFNFLDANTLSASGAYCIDRIHPNALGHAAIAADLNPKVTVVCDVY